MVNLHLTMLVVLLLSQDGRKLSEVLVPHRQYVQIPETNFRVGEPRLIMDGLAERFVHEEIDWLDGLTIKTLEWWANIRPSSNEPLLRLNIEAKTPDMLERVRVELIEAIKQLDQSSA